MIEIENKRQRIVQSESLLPSPISVSVTTCTFLLHLHFANAQPKEKNRNRNFKVSKFFRIDRTGIELCRPELWQCIRETRPPIDHDSVDVAVEEVGQVAWRTSVHQKCGTHL